jgi:hypothetical protein
MEDKYGVSASDRVAIIEANLKQIRGSIYNEVIKKRVADNVGDTAMSDATKKELERLEKLKDAYLEIHKEELNATRNS